MENKLFESIFNENFEDDYTDYQQKSADYDRLNKKLQTGKDFLSSVEDKKYVISINGKIWHLKNNDGDILVKSTDEKNNQKDFYQSAIDWPSFKIFKKAYANDRNGEINRVIEAMFRYAVGDYNEMIFNNDDEERSIETLKQYKAFKKQVYATFDKWDEDHSEGGEFDKMKTAYYNRLHAERDAYGARHNAEKKARGSLSDETPDDLKENDFAIWQSKDGKRKVTVLSIDEPNNRAKINTAKGATLYVPLNTLSKFVDYKSKGLGWYEDYRDEE